MNLNFQTNHYLIGLIQTNWDNLKMSVSSTLQGESVLVLDADLFDFTFSFVNHASNLV